MTKKTVRVLKRVFWLNFTGLVFGVGFYGLALTPSLLPMGPAASGLVAGSSFAFGYLIGSSLAWIWRKVIGYEPPRVLKKYAWITIGLTIPIAMVSYGIWSARWQDSVRDLIGLHGPQESFAPILIIVAFVTAYLLISLGRFFGYLSVRLEKHIEKIAPRRIVRPMGALLTITLVVLIFNGVLMRSFMRISTNHFREQHAQTQAGVTNPNSPLRSGGPGSLVSWDSLGRQGQRFIDGGPTQKQLTKYNDDVLMPIRIYVGAFDDKELSERVDLAIAEMHRTGAFEREVINVITPTGTGWIMPHFVNALDYAVGGDVAHVAVQYSFMPSWIAIVEDQERAVDTGKALFNAVYNEWREMPEDSRPKLVAHGISLGAYGAQAAFSGEEDMKNRLDGALFVGSPSFSEPMGYFMDNRREGSGVFTPIYNDGLVVRFGSSAEEFLDDSFGEWGFPRVAYLNNPTDPIVWLDTDLISSRPDWLKEPRSPKISQHMTWYPFVTFMQVATNQIYANISPGDGHNYSNLSMEAWVAVLGLDYWDQNSINSVQNELRGMP